MKSKINVILLGILIFLLGSIAGAVSHNLYWRYFKKPPKPLSFIEILARDLKLDADQQVKVRAIAKETKAAVFALNKQFKPQYDAVNKDYFPRMDVIRQESDQKIRSILRDDQKLLFEQFLRRGPKPPQIKNAKPNKNK
jgi:hypothetical protein